MTGEGKQAKQISLGDDFGAANITLNGLRLEVDANGRSVRVVSEAPVGIIWAANENKASTAIDLAQRTPLEQRVLEVGQRLRDGTVCIFVDPAEDVSLRVPGKIFAGWADFDSQDIAVRKANTEALNGHKDWGRITAAQGKILSDVWDKALLKFWQEEGRRFAPPEFEKQGWQDKDRPWFWLASPGGNSGGRVRRGGEADWSNDNRSNSYPVPVVRSGPARSLDI